MVTRPARHGWKVSWLLFVRACVPPPIFPPAATLPEVNFFPAAWSWGDIPFRLHSVLKGCRDAGVWGSMAICPQSWVLSRLPWLLSKWTLGSQPLLNTHTEISSSRRARGILQHFIEHSRQNCSVTCNRRPEAMLSLKQCSRAECVTALKLPRLNHA